MKITKSWIFENVHKLNRTIVVVDVWACSTNINIILSKKASKLILAEEKELIRFLQYFKNPVLIGQVKNKQISLDFSNEPFDVYHARLSNRDVILTTFNGIKAFKIAARFSDRVLSCSINNLHYVAKFLKDFGSNIHIIMAGENGKPNPEDESVATWLAMLIENKKINLQLEKKRLLENLLTFPSYHFSEKKKEQYYPFLFQDNINILPILSVNKRYGYLEVKKVCIE